MLKWLTVLLVVLTVLDIATTEVGFSYGLVESNRLYYVFGEAVFYIYCWLLTFLMVFLVYSVHKECKPIKYCLLVPIGVRVACVINNSFLLLCHV